MCVSLFLLSYSTTIGLCALLYLFSSCTPTIMVFTSATPPAKPPLLALMAPTNPHVLWLIMGRSRRLSCLVNSSCNRGAVQVEATFFFIILPTTQCLQKRNYSRSCNRHLLQSAHPVVVVFVAISVLLVVVFPWFLFLLPKSILGLGFLAVFFNQTKSRVASKPVRRHQGAYKQYVAILIATNTEGFFCRSGSSFFFVCTTAPRQRPIFYYSRSSAL